MLVAVERVWFLVARLRRFGGVLLAASLDLEFVLEGLLVEVGEYMRCVHEYRQCTDHGHGSVDVQQETVEYQRQILPVAHHLHVQYTYVRRDASTSRGSLRSTQMPRVLQNLTSYSCSATPNSYEGDEISRYLAQFLRSDAGQTDRRVTTDAASETEG